VKSQEDSSSGELIRQRSDIEIEKDGFEQGEGLSNAQEEWNIEDVFGVIEIEQKQVKGNKEHPQRENLVRCGFVLLADQQELDEDSDADAGDIEHVHGRTVLLGLHATEMKVNDSR